ncbi:MAG: AAA family ATPase [gamma proteobacterium endosymbiont of Lamellibrachia anaximandri]|nr:AAA family ATPase [gamma proteobacterium endosymbiont of Lamellibrachia anaximandri]
MGDSMAQQQSLISALQRAEAYPHAVDEIEHIETHISHVLLAGEFVYKIKKPVDLGFLDFSTLERRRYFCGEELRLNRRLAPELYLDLVTITGDYDTPVIDGKGEILEYAVRMRRFPQSSLFDRTLPDKDMVLRLARRVARFHAVIPVADPGESYGEPQSVLQPMLENFAHIRVALDERGGNGKLTSLETWTRKSMERLLPVIRQRREQGHIRECHGDMHLGNIARFQGRICIFDGIEFNPLLHWIDTLSDMAFLLMDLKHKGLLRQAACFLNAYLETSGDYDGLPLLPFYLVYRAMVRAKVTAIRLAQSGLSGDERRSSEAEYAAHIDLACRLSQARQPALIITHGFSGSGKSRVAGWLVEHLPAIQVRSDVERKRQYGHLKGESGGLAPDEGIYRPEMTEATYSRLHAIATTAIQAGYTTIIDATFLDAEVRDRFIELAQTQACPLLILACHAPIELLRQRVQQRNREGNDPSDADLAVLERQLKKSQAFSVAEQPFLLEWDTTEAPSSVLLEQISARLNLRSDEHS